MQTICENLSEKIDGIPAVEILQRQQALDAMRAEFDNMQRLLSRLPKNVQERIWIVLAEELQHVGIKFSVEIASRLTASEYEEARKELHAGEDEMALHRILSKRLAMVRG